MEDGTMGDDRPTYSLASKPDHLLDSQKPAVRGIIDHICSIATKIPPRNSRAETSSIADDERPHYAFLIDGGRGSGKTYTLLTIRQILLDLENPDADTLLNKSPFGEFLFGDRDPESKEPTGLPGADTFLKQVRAGRAAGLELIKIIFPGDMIGGDSVMESVFAEVSQRITDRLDDLEKREGVSRSAKAIETFKELAENLRKDVEQGWYFARRFGLEPLYRDSLDYEDLVQRWGEQVKRASFRIDKWRRFVSDYLDACGKSILVVMIDDSDVKPDLTEDVLHSIRMFLNHPRIAIVLSGNLKSMRDALIYQAMRRIGPSVDALNQSAHPSATEWRRRERQQIEEYLEKVLPPAHRYYVSPPRTDQAPRGSTSGSDKPKDFQRIAGIPIQQYLTNAQTYMRRPFLNAKFRLALIHELNRPDAPHAVDRTSLEMFLAWWIFGDVYADTLNPTSARQIATFREYFRAFQAEPKRTKDNEVVELPRQSRKRLPVALFDIPSNHLMIQRLGDEDTSVADWLRRQQLASDWSARRTLVINQREIHEASFTYNFLCYRLDLGLSLPVRDNIDEIIPTELLPQLVGRKYMRRFFQPRQMPRRQRRLGVCRWIDHAAMPGNCIYFHDLRTIPNISCYSPSGTHQSDSLERLQSGLWEAQLADKWFELIEDRRESAEDESLLRYFREIVCESLRHTEHISTAELINELDPPDIYRKQLFSIYEHFITDEIGGFTATAPERREMWLGAFKSPTRNLEYADAEGRVTDDARATPPRLYKTEKTDSDENATASWPPRAPRRMIALYSALVTDLRRAWQAIRQYGAARGVAGAIGSETGQLSSLSVVANHDRMQLYKREDIEALLKRSPWIRELLGVFSKKNVDNTFKQWIENNPETPLLGVTKVDIKQIQQIFQADKTITDQVQSLREPIDFHEWTQTLRVIGRSVCHLWPVHHISPIDLEKELFANAAAGDPKAYLLKIFAKLPKDPPAESPAEETEQSRKERARENNERRRQTARSARNFVWLLYGLAPSLPAVIHAHIMSLIYEGELNVRAHKDAVEAGPDNYLHRNLGTFSRLALQAYGTPGNPPSDASAGAKDKTKRTQTSGALEEIEKWAELIGALSVMLRYIKIKCLHLDTTLMFRKTTNHDPNDVIELLKKSGYEIEGAAPKVGRLTKEQQKAAQAEDERARKLFSDQVGASIREIFTEKHIAEGLAIFPDVSPSTLFGDGWLEDILSRSYLSEQLQAAMKPHDLRYRIVAVPASRDDAVLDNPLSVNGVFGETEQWLWSANRTLSKLKEKLKKRRSNIEGKLKKTGSSSRSRSSAPAKRVPAKSRRKSIKGAR